MAANIYLDRINQADHYYPDLWGDLDKEALGYPLYVGDDKGGNSIYSLGVGADVPMVVRTIEQLVKMLNCSERDLTVAPVFIKRGRLLLLLHRVGYSKLLNRLIQPFIGCLLDKEFTFIKQQVEEVKVRVGSA